MNLGIDITHDAIRLSVFGEAGFADTTIRGYTLTDSRNLSDAYWEAFLKEFRAAVRALLSDVPPQITLMSVPMICGYADRMVLNKRFRSAGFRIDRLLSRGGAKGIYIRSLLEKEEDKVCCCIGKNGGWLEFSWFFPQDVIDPEVNRTCTSSAFRSNPGIAEEYSSVRLRKNRSSRCPVEYVWFSDELDRKDKLFSVLTASKECRVIDEYAASRGACLYAGVLAGTETAYLLLDRFPEEIVFTAADGESLTLLPSGATVPIIRHIELDRNLPEKDTELRISLRNPHTAEVTEFTSFRTACPVNNGKLKFDLQIDVSGTPEVTLCTDVRTEPNPTVEQTLKLTAFKEVKGELL